MRPGPSLNALVDPRQSPVLFKALLRSLASPDRPGIDAHALLIEARDDAAAFALLENQALLVVLSCPHFELPPPTVLLARLTKLLGNERRAVLDGTAAGYLHLLLLGPRELTLAWLEAAPPRYDPLERRIVYHHLDVDGAPRSEHRVRPEAGELKHTTKVGDEVSSVLAVALPKAARSCAAPNLTADDLKRIEAEGEQALIEESGFNAAVGVPFVPVLASIGVALVVFFVLQCLWGGSESDQTLYRMGASLSADIRAGAWWRMLSAGYLHLGIVHLLSNLVGVGLFGYVLERVLGPARFLVLYTLSILGGGAATALIDQNSLGAGASGGIFGLLAGLAMLSLRSSRVLPRFSAVAIKYFAVYYLAWNLFASLRPGVGLAAHLGGGLTGAALVWSGLITWRLPKWWAGERGSRAVAWLYGLLGIAALAVTVYALHTAFDTGRPWELGSSPALIRTPLVGTQVSIDVPAPLLARAQIDRQEAGTEFSYGDGQLDPVLIGIWIEKLSEAVPPVGIAAALEARRQAFEANPPASDSHKRYATPPKVVTVDGRPVLFVDQVHSEVIRLPRWVLIEGDTLVDLQLSLAPELDGDWAALEPLLVRSVRFGGRYRDPH